MASCFKNYSFYLESSHKPNEENTTAATNIANPSIQANINLKLFSFYSKI